MEKDAALESLLTMALNLIQSEAGGRMCVQKMPLFLPVLLKMPP